MTSRREMRDGFLITPDKETHEIFVSLRAYKEVSCNEVRKTEIKR
jgi:hypothetical protein